MDERDDLFLYLLRCWRVAARYWYVILLVPLLAGVTTAVVSVRYIEPVYKASTIILVSAGNTSPMSALAGALGLPGVGGPQSDLVPVLKSRRVAAKVVRRLRLDKEYRVPTERAAVGILRGAMRFDLDREGQLTITASAPRARLAADIADAYPTALSAYRRSEDTSAARRQVRYVENALVRTRGELERAEEALKRFQERHTLVAMEPEAAAVAQRRAQVETDLAGLQVSLQESRKRLAAMLPRMRDRAATDGAPAPPGGDVDRLRTKLVELESDLLTVLSSYKEEHPQVVELRSSIAALKRQLRRQVAKSVSAVDRELLPELIDLRVTVIAGEARQAALRVEEARLASKVRALPETMLRYARLNREVRTKEGIHQMLMDQLYRARIAADQANPPIRPLDPAEAPDAPSSPNVKRNVVLATFLGLLAALFLAFALSMLESMRKLAAMERQGLVLGPPESSSTRELDRAGRE